MSLTITHTQADGHVHIDVSLPPKPTLPENASITRSEPEANADPQAVHQRSLSTFTSSISASQSPLLSQKSIAGAVVKSYGPLNGHRSVSSSSSLTEKSLPLVPVHGDAYNTLDSVRQRVAQGVAWRAISHAQTIDGIKIGVALTLATASSPEDAENMLGYVVQALRASLKLHQYVFAVASAGPHAYRSSNSMSRSSSYSGSLTDSSKRHGKGRAEPPRWPLVLVGSSAHLVEKAATLACAKFLGRLREVRAEGGDRWLGYIEDTYLSDESIDGSWGTDEAMIWDIVRKTSHVINPKTPPRGARSSGQLLASARSRLERLSPEQALSELHSLTYALPVVLVDIRPSPLRQLHGEVPDSLIIARTDLEFKFDPRLLEERLSIADRYDLRVIVMDQDGRASSLAAVALHEIGLLNATDIVGGFEAWKKAGLPTFVQPEGSVISL